MQKQQGRLSKLYKEEKEFRQGLWMLIIGILIAVLATTVLPIQSKTWKTVISFLGIGLSFAGSELLSKYAMMLGGEDYKKRQEKKQ